MRPWTEQEKQQLRRQTIDPSKSSPEKLTHLVSHFRASGTVWGVTEGRREPHVSKELAKKVQRFTAEGELDWVLSRGRRSSVGIKSPTEVPRDILRDIDNLADTIHRHLEVPKPDTPLLSYEKESARQEEAEIASDLERGRGSSYLRLFMTSNQTPWWRSDGEVEVTLNLTLKEHALLERLLELPQSQDLKTALSLWLDACLKYLQFARGKARGEKMEAAYSAAIDASERARISLRRTVEAIRWGVSV